MSIDNQKSGQTTTTGEAVHSASPELNPDALESIVGGLAGITRSVPVPDDGRIRRSVPVPEDGRVTPVPEDGKI